MRLKKTLVLKNQLIVLAKNILIITKVHFNSPSINAVKNKADINKSLIMYNSYALLGFYYC